MGAPSVPRAWDRSWLVRFLGSIDDPRAAAILSLFATTGVRKGDLVGLKWSDIDMATGLATISRRVVRLGRGVGISKDRVGEEGLEPPASRM